MYHCLLPLLTSITSANVPAHLPPLPPPSWVVVVVDIVIVVLSLLAVLLACLPLSLLLSIKRFIVALSVTTIAIKHCHKITTTAAANCQPLLLPVECGVQFPLSPPQSKPQTHLKLIVVYSIATALTAPTTTVATTSTSRCFCCQII